MVTGNGAIGTLGEALTAANTATTVYSTYVLTQQQYVQMLAYGQLQQQQTMNQLAVAYQQQVRDDSEALERSKELFEHHLTERQRSEWHLSGSITVRGGYSGADYCIDVAIKPYNIFGRVILDTMNGHWIAQRRSMFSHLTNVRICCAPSVYDISSYRGMPMYDTVLGQKLALELDEIAFWSKANISRT